MSYSAFSLTFYVVLETKNILLDFFRIFLVFVSTVKPVYNDHHWDPKIVAVVERWSLFKGHLCSKSLKWDLKIVVIIDRWSLFGGGHYSEVVVSPGLTVLTSSSQVLFCL